MHDLSQIKINRNSNESITTQLKEQLTWLIANNSFKQGDRLPAMRVIAQALEININTVRSVYSKMAADGLVEIRQGSGIRVLPLEVEGFLRPAGDHKSHTLGVILPSISNPFFHAFLQGIEKAAKLGQQLLLVCDAHDDPALCYQYFLQLVAKKVDGIIVSSFDILESGLLNTKSKGDFFRGLPVVTADWPDKQNNAVCIDMENAGYLATRHLIEHGHHRIGFINFRDEVANVAVVERGYQKAMLEHGLQPDSDLIAIADGFDLQHGEIGCAALMSKVNQPTAILGISDLVAIGAMRWLRSNGINVPGDVAVVGIDDIPLANLIEPKLTTVRLPAYEMGNKAMLMLNQLITNEIGDSPVLSLPVELVIRQSCGH